MIFTGSKMKSWIKGRWVDAEHREAFAAEFEQGENLVNREVLLQRNDGSSFWALVTWEHIDYRGDDCMLHWVYDIDRLKQAEAAFEGARAELEMRVDERTRELRKEAEERQRAQETLRARNKLLHTLIEAIPAPVFFKDADHIYRDCNPAFEAFIGLSSREIIGKGVFDVAPSDLAKVYRRADDELIKNGGNQIYEAQVRYSDGSLHNVEFNKAVVTEEDGSAAGIVGVMLDITERRRTEIALRESEERFRDIAEVSADYFGRRYVCRLPWHHQRHNRAHAKRGATAPGPQARGRGPAHRRHRA